MKLEVEEMGVEEVCVKKLLKLEVEEVNVEYLSAEKTEDLRIAKNYVNTDRSFSRCRFYKCLSWSLRVPEPSK